MLLATGVALAQATTPTSPQGEPPKTPKGKIPDSYIVVLKDSENPDQVAQKKEKEHGIKAKHVYRNALKGFSAEISPDQVAAVRANPEVKYVEQDGVVQALDHNTANTTPSSTNQVIDWGINKIEADESTTDSGNHSGVISNVWTHIIDTGIDTAHSDLKVGRHVNPSGASGGNKDCQGHGTHVAGTATALDNNGYVVGVAPGPYTTSGSRLTGVKVLNCSGSGTWSGVIKGIDWVTKDARGGDNKLGTADDRRPAVANMSLGGGGSTAVDEAVKNSASTDPVKGGGVFYALAAGNDGKDACNSSPARAGRGNNGILTVGATNTSDAKASFSNYGPCVDIWAPGVSILSTKKGGGTTKMSGTSMASPHGVGAGALWLSSNTTDLPTAVETKLKSTTNSTSAGPRLNVHRDRGY